MLLRATFFFLSLFLGGALFAQKAISLNWQPQAASENDQLEAFSGCDWSPETPGIPRYCASFAPGTDGQTVEVFDYQTEALSAREQRLLADFPLAPEPKVSLERGYSREGRAQLSYCLIPYIKRDGRIFRLVRFETRLIGAAPPRPAVARPSGKSAQASVLSTGTWHKLALSETGIYKITPSYLSERGISSQTVATSDLRLVGNGVGILPEAMTENRPEDLQEWPLTVVDENGDGVFNGQDYALFYAFGPHQWNYNSNQERFRYRINIYRDQNFYFLSVDAGAGTRMSTVASLAANPDTVIRSFDDYQVVEDDRVNLVGTGRRWLGDVFEFTLSYNYGFEFPDIVTTEPAQLQVNCVGRSSTAGTVLRSAYLGSTILNNPIPALSTFGSYPNFVQESNQSASFLPQGPNITLNLSYDNSANPSAIAWLDRIELQVRRHLRMSGRQLAFRDWRQTLAPGRVAEYQIEAAPNDLQVWEISDRVAGPQQINGSIVNNEYRFRVLADEQREFVAFRGSDFPSPSYVSRVEPQNIRQMEVPEMIVISHPRFLSAANDLASFHNQSGDVSTAVVTTEQVYNEFGGGGQDITALRDFIKSLYDRPGPKQLQYVLLFGDASYDYKDRLEGNSNYVPVWQSGASFSLGNSSITDDYYAYMDPGEGTRFNGAVMDLGVGRIPCESPAQAANYVRKVKHYVESSATLGDWRNRILLVADDVDEWWEERFVKDSELLDRKVEQASPAFNVEKVYLDAYQQQTTTGGQRYPEARRDLFRKVQRGNLLTNFIGHGGEVGWTSERVLQLADVNGWNNFDAMPLFVTITCEFTRFDDPRRVSAGEQLLLNPDGGAIALLSTTRVVGAQTGTDLNLAVFDTILARPGGRSQTLGQIVRAAKNDRDVVGRDTKNKFSLVGDPALRLPVPYYEVATRSIQSASMGKKGSGTSSGKAALPLTAAGTSNNSGLVLSEERQINDTLRALNLVQLSGELKDLSQQNLSNFEGEVSVSVFDKSAQRQTLVNDGVGSPVSFRDQTSVIHRGRVEVKEGQFNLEFRVPLGINYQFGQGKISYYALSAQSGIDAAGAFDDFIVGGLDEDAPRDERGPEIELFMNDESFVRGGITGAQPFLLAKLADSSGINTVGNNVGQDLRAVLNDRNDQPIILNEFYQSDLNSYQSGEVRYQFFDLEPGEYRLQLRAFDIYNNPSEAFTEFIVAEDEELVLRRVLNYPNPFTTYTEFQFEHNRANQALEVQVQVFSVSGKLVKTINVPVNSSGNRVTGIAWDGLDDYGDKIGKGVYVYRVKVRSLSDNSQADKYEKLVILR